MGRPVKDLAASIRQRLQRIEDLQQDFQYVLIRYASERLLYRLCRSPYRDRFVLKGAMLFAVWSGNRARPTRDVDLLGYGPPDREGLRQIFREICAVECPEDGLSFDIESVGAAEIREAGEYGGIRVTATAHLGQSRITIQADVGFGDAIVPLPEVADYPVLIPLPVPRLRMYSRESVVAEKFQIMVELGLPNSRMKDYFDVARLAGDHEFDGTRLAEALRVTFERRRTPLPAELPSALGDEFTSDLVKRTQWESFLRRRHLEGDGMTLANAAATIAEFLLPLSRSLARGERFTALWPPGGPWQSRARTG